jgi:hypothetical protein
MFENLAYDQNFSVGKFFVVFVGVAHVKESPSLAFGVTENVQYHVCCMITYFCFWMSVAVDEQFLMSFICASVINHDITKVMGQQ